MFACFNSRRPWLWLCFAGISGEVSSQAHIDLVRAILFEHYLPEVRIPELFLVDVDKILDEFEERVADAKADRDVIPDGEIKIIQVRSLTFASSLKNCQPWMFLKTSFLLIRLNVVDLSW